MIFPSDKTIRNILDLLTPKIITIRDGSQSSNYLQQKNNSLIYNDSTLC